MVEKGVLGGFAPDRHGADGFHAGGHCLDKALVYPASDAALLSRRALTFHRTGRVGGAP
jgi:hypothetical protein